LFYQRCAMCIKQPALVIKKINLRTPTIETYRFTVKDFEKSADGSADIFLRWFKLAQICIEVTGPHKVTSIQICASSPKRLLELRVPTKVTSKRISQANYFYRTSISRASTHPQHWNLIRIKYPIINFFYSFMKLSFPTSTFNAHTYFFARSEKLLHENKQKTPRTTKNLFNNWENQSQAVRKQFILRWSMRATLKFSSFRHLKKIN